MAIDIVDHDPTWPARVDNYAKAVEILTRHAAEDAARAADAQGAGANPAPGCMPGPVEL